jgi:Cu(I)/Ag(I) efflux system membrane fusion protein
MSVVWIDAAFSPADVTHLKIGQGVDVTFAAQPNEKVAGKVLYLYPSVTESSRTARVRIEVPNRTGGLTPGMFADVDVAGEPEKGLIVPEDAVLDSGRQKAVFVAVGNGRFEPRDVTVGLHTNNQYIVLSGLNEGERVVTRAAFMLDSESRLVSALENYDARTPSTSSPTISQTSLTFLTSPDPPRAGKTQLEVRLVGADRSPVTDASLEVRFYMAPMPSMNMPAMNAATHLDHVGDGVYRGTGTFAMAGPWDVTVLAARQGSQIAEKRLSLVVR